MRIGATFCKAKPEETLLSARQICISRLRFSEKHVGLSGTLAIIAYSQHSPSCLTPLEGAGIRGWWQHFSNQNQREILCLQDESIVGIGNFRKMFWNVRSYNCQHSPPLPHSRKGGNSKMGATFFKSKPGGNPLLATRCLISRLRFS